MNCSSLESHRAERDRNDPVRRYARRVTAILALVLSANASGHDFFLSPPALDASSTNADVHFFVGHHGHYRPWTHGQTHVEDIRHFVPDGRTTRIEASAPDSVALDARVPGTHMVTLTSRTSRSTLEADKFLRYLQSEGLEHIVTLRKARGQSRTKGIETYSRRAKTLIQSGDVFSTSVTAPVGLDLEIVPLENPFSLAKDEPLEVQVLYQGKPLANAKVELESLSVSAIPESAQRTNRRGQVSLAYPKQGAWKVHVVWSVPDPDEKAEFVTWFASLTFAYAS